MAQVVEHLPNKFQHPELKPSMPNPPRKKSILNAIVSIDRKVKDCISEFKNSQLM
jgi:hypothetical protein